MLTKDRALRFVGPLFGLFVFVVALRVLARELAGERFRDILRQLSAIPASQIALALLITAASFLVLTGYDRLSLRYVRKPLPYRRIAFASFLNYAFSQGLGFPLLTGGSVRYRLYSGWGLSAVHIANLVVFASLTFWLGVLTVGGIVFLHASPGISALMNIPPQAVRPIGAAALTVVGAYVWWTVVGRRIVRIRDWRFRRPSPTLALSQLTVACCDWVIAGSVLYVLLPPDLGIAFPAFLGVFLLAFVAGIASNVPAGLGVFETVIIYFFPARASDSAIIGSLIVYRAVYYLLPLVTAAVLLGTHELLLKRERIARLAESVGQWAPAFAPNVFAITAFLGGVILLVSGATPSPMGRLQRLSDGLPLAVIEISHFFASIVGIGLVLLSTGLQRRLDAAWRLTAGLLAAGAVLSLLKGLDYEEAIALSIMLAALLPARRHFHRQASLFADPFTPGWVTAVSFVLVGTAWLAMFSYKHVDYSPELWWRFAVEADAPRSLRALVGVTLLVLGVAIARMLRPSAGALLPPTVPNLERARAIIGTSGDSLAHLALLGDKSFLFSDSGQSFVMYAVERRSWVALGDPVGLSDERAELAWRFRELSNRQGGRPTFYLASRRHLPMYVDLGLTLLKIGDEARVPLRDFTLESPARESLRHAHELMRQEGLSFEIVPSEQALGVLPELAPISEAWLAAKKAREKHFSLGRFSPDYLRHFPLAVARRDGRAVAFANVWGGADREELTTDLMRHDPAVPRAVLDWMLVELLRWGHAERYRWFSLGVAPLSGLEHHSLAPLWTRVGALEFRLGEHFESFQGLRAYKERFDPVWEPRYIASPGGLTLPRIISNIATLISGERVPARRRSHRKRWRRPPGDDTSRR